MAGPSQKPSFSKWVTVAFGAIGLLIGFFAGLSMTPVVGILMPLLFTAIGSGAGFFLNRKPEHSGEIGKSIAALAILALVGGIWAVHVRTGASWKCTLIGCSREPTPAKLRLPKMADPATLAVLLRIRTRLETIEMDENEREAIFQAAVQTPTTAFYVLSVLDETHDRQPEKRADEIRTGGYSPIPDSEGVGINSKPRMPYLPDPGKPPD